MHNPQQMNDTAHGIYDITFAGHAMQISSTGALFWPDESLLVFSDLHCEKGSFLAHAGSVLPCYDTADTLSRMAAMIALFSPAEVLCLGDSFHDMNAAKRMSADACEMLRGMIKATQQWHWILGNHDPELPAWLGGKRHHCYRRGNIAFLHEPEAEYDIQIVGHFHPKVRLKLGGQRIGGRCLVHNEALMIVPSFGSYTGGLDISHEAISGLFITRPIVHLLYRNRIWPLPANYSQLR